MPALFLSGLAWGGEGGAGRTVVLWARFKEKIIKQGRMEICTEKLFCVGILNPGLRKK